MMKKQFLFLLLVFFAEAHGHLPFGVRGVNAGLSFSSFRREDTDITSCPSLGIWGKGSLSENSAVVWEINYTTKGGILKNEPMYNMDNDLANSYYAYDFFFKWSFYEIPITLVYYFPIRKHARLSFFSGPSILFYQKDKSSFKEGRFLYYWQPDVQTEYHWADSDYGYQRKRQRFGYHIGAGLQYRNFAFDLRYSVMDQYVYDLVQNIKWVSRKIHCVTLNFKADIVGLIKDRK